MGKHRDKLHEMLDEGVLSAQTLARDLLNFLSEDECEQFATSEGIELFPDEDEDSDDSTVYLYDDIDELREGFADHWAERLQQCPAYEGDEAARRQLWDVWLQEQRDDGNVSEKLADSATLQDE
jgi:hypothetical protein